MYQLKRIFIRSLGGTIILISLFVMSCASSEKNTSTSSERDYQELKAPDRIHVYYENREWVLMPADEGFSEIHTIIQKGWDAGKDQQGLLNIAQLIYLEESQVPESMDRVVYEYDSPIHWRIDPDSAESEEAMNNYIFFLNWDQSWAVICRDGDYKKRAFLPQVTIAKEQILALLEEMN